VLIPGLLADRALWRHQIEHLAELADVFVPAVGPHDTMRRLGRSILDQIDADRFALGGQSLGGYLCMELLRQAPTRIARLALLDTRAGAYTREEAAERKRWIADLEKGDFESMLDELSVACLHPRNAGKPEMVAELKAMGRRVGKPAAIAHIRAMIDRPDSAPDLRRVRVPAVVVGGRHDPIVPISLQMRTAALIPDASFVPIEDCGHYSEFEQPAAVTAVLRYWLQAD
jgi:pimeloyl-ACP methyl ester carboxylesterase